MQVLLMQYDGDGPRYTFVCTDRKAPIDRSWDFKEVNGTLFLIADVVDGEEGDLDDMTLELKCFDQKLKYNKERDQFIPQS